MKKKRNKFWWAETFSENGSSYQTREQNYISELVKKSDDIKKTLENPLTQWYYVSPNVWVSNEYGLLLEQPKRKGHIFFF